jgi:hypothetical protein
MVRGARQQLPSSHRALLEHIGVQEAVISGWPQGVLNVYRTLRETPPEGRAVEGAVAVWLQERRLVAFNGDLLEHLIRGLDRRSQEATMNWLAWHEYGHAISATQASTSQKQTGVRLLERLPPGLRSAIDYPGSYSRLQVFDEVIANTYALMIGRAVQQKDYGRPDFLDADVYDAFVNVVPWPPTDR